MKVNASPIQLIIGLGNPGNDYAQTRHNAGQIFVERLARRYSAPLNASNKFFGDASRAMIGGREVRLLVPTTYMNRSGQAVSALAKFYKIAPENMLVVHDELDLSPGTARLKLGGGHGGHNGLRDIISSLGNQSGFARLRLGIGHPGHASQVTGYVLKRAPADENDKIDNAIDAALDSVEDLARGEWEKAVRELHSKK